MAVQADFTFGTIDINSGAYSVAWWDQGTIRRNAVGLLRRTVVIGLNIEDASITAVWDRVHALEEQLGLARLAAANPQGGHSNITLDVQIGASSQSGSITVMDGDIRVPQNAFSVSMEQGAVEWSNVGSGIILELECLPYFLGAAYTPTGSPFTVNKAGNFTFYIADILGDVPADVTYEIIDNSSGVVLNKLLISHKSQPDLDSGDWTPVIDCAAGSGGTLTGSFPDAVDSDYAGDSSLLFSDGWNEIATASPGAPFADQAGVYDVYGRVYDSIAVPHPPRNLATGLIDPNGTLPAGNYTFVVTTINASGESAPSESLTFQLIAPQDRVTIDWDAPILSTPTDYRLYFKRDTQDWKYFAVGSTTTELTLSTESGATTADPPSESDVLASTFRGRVSGSSGVTQTTGRLQPAQLSNGQWEPVKLFSGVAHPPITLEEGGTVEQWEDAIEAHRQDGATVPAVRVDALWMLPSENVVEAEYLPLNLATLRKWIISRTRHGNTHGVLRSKSDDSEQGQLSVSNPPVLGPGDTQVVFLPLVAGGVWNVSGISLSVAVTIRPRFKYLRGGT